MTQALPQTTSHKTALKSVGEPHVKSAETRELFNAGVSGNSKTAKSADPTCYDVSRSNLGPGCLKNKSERQMKQVGNYVLEIHDTTAEERWGVRMAGDSEHISKHRDYAGALAAAKRYEAADKRRQADRDLSYCCKLVGM